MKMMKWMSSLLALMLSVSLLTVPAWASAFTNVSADENIAETTSAVPPYAEDYDYDFVKVKYPTTERFESTIWYPDAPGKEFPVIGFVHGFMIISDFTWYYEHLIEHLCRKGYIVISVNYQELVYPETDRYPEVAASQFQEGFAYIRNHAETIPQMMTDENGEILFGLVAHSAGCVTSMNLLADYQELGLPRPRFIATMSGNDGGSGEDPRNTATGNESSGDASTDIQNKYRLVRSRDYTKINANTNLLMIVAEEEDDNTFDWSSYAWNTLTQIPEANRQWIELYSDSNGDETLVADHDWCGAFGDYVDEFDTYGSYKWITALANDTFYGKDRIYWYGGTAEHLYLGTFAAGTLIKQPEVSATTCIMNRAEPADE